MPSLAEVHGRSDGGPADATTAVGEPVSAEDAVQLTLELSATGVLLFVLGLGFAFFFDSLLGTVSYLVILGLVAVGLVRWFRAVRASSTHPAGLFSNSRSRSPSRSAGLGTRSGVLAAVQRRLSGRRRRRRRARYASRNRPNPFDRIRRMLRSARSSRRGGGERL